MECGKKNLDISLENVNAYILNNALVITFDRQWKAISSAIVGGGFSYIKHILNIHVPKGYHSEAPERDVEAVARKIGIKGNLVGMMTAADLNNVSTASISEKDMKVEAIVTGGVSNATAAGDDVEDGGFGTINIILLIDSNLADPAMVNAVKTATEAKTLALHDLDVRSTKSKDIATGTSTDTIAIACSGRGGEERYAGTATLLGSMIGRVVRKAVREAVQKQDNIFVGMR